LGKIFLAIDNLYTRCHDKDINPTKIIWELDNKEKNDIKLKNKKA